ncbi:hypothetical protein niasHT_003484 [Heterodera trifolii]|uniref:Uncharacterized protein n=1 Tax=Heterodera trifolii TaxID=157864 RepID=A0ABD2LVC0_9BILA
MAAAAHQRQKLCETIERWNATMMDIFAIKHGVPRSDPLSSASPKSPTRQQQQSSPSSTTGALATKCMRVSSIHTVAHVMDALVAKFHAEANAMHMAATTPASASYSLWEVTTMTTMARVALASGTWTRTSDHCWYSWAGVVTTTASPPATRRGATAASAACRRHRCITVALCCADGCRVPDSRAVSRDASPSGAAIVEQQLPEERQNLLPANSATVGIGSDSVRLAYELPEALPSQSAGESDGERTNGLKGPPNCNAKTTEEQQQQSDRHCDWLGQGEGIKKDQCISYFFNARKVQLEWPIPFCLIIPTVRKGIDQRGIFDQMEEQRPGQTRLHNIGDERAQSGKISKGKGKKDKAQNNA